MIQNGQIKLFAYSHISAQQEALSRRNVPMGLSLRMVQLVYAHHQSVSLVRRENGVKTVKKKDHVILVISVWPVPVSQILKETLNLIVMD